MTMQGRLLWYTFCHVHFGKYMFKRNIICRFCDMNVDLRFVKTTNCSWIHPLLAQCCVCVRERHRSWPTATAAAAGQLAVQLMREVRMAAGTLPFERAERPLRIVLGLRAALERGFDEAARSRLCCFRRSSSRTLHWERLMKSGLDLRSASCQKHKTYCALWQNN